MSTIDFSGLEIFKNALEAITDEAALTIVRTARSLTTKESMDFSTALFNVKGEQVAQGLCLPFQVGALPEFMPTVLREFSGSLEPGDIIASNDPYLGGTHLPDLLLFKPIFISGELLGFAAVLAHLTDIGGRVPGGNAVDSTEIYQEGLRLPPVKLYRSGQPNEWVFRLIASNVRVSHHILGDIEALVSALNRAEQAFQQLCKQYTNNDINRLFVSLLDYSEKLTRIEIDQMPNGNYEFEDFIDTDASSSESIRICCRLSIKDDDVNVDFTGTSSQVPSALNMLPSTGKAAVCCALRCVFMQDIPNNAGTVRPIRIIFPEGSILNPLEPAACAARGVVAYRVFDAVMGCLAQALPDRVPAAGEGGVAFLTLGGKAPDETPFVFVDVLSAGWGGRPSLDGIDGTSHLGANIRLTSVEVIESQFPVRVERREFISDSGGPGRYRGGLGYRYDLRLLAPVAAFTVRADRARFRPWGLAGGTAGAPAACVVDPDSDQPHSVPLLHTGTLHRGQIVRLELAGSGGFGPAFERDPEDVLRDVLTEKVSLRSAKEDYGVVLIGSPLRIDHDATREFRVRAGAV